MSAQSAPAQPTAHPGGGSNRHGFDQIWNDAQQLYKDTTKREFPLAGDFPTESRDPDKVIEYIVQQEAAFKGFRVSGKKIRNVLKPIVKVVLMFVDAGAEAAAACNVKPGGKAIFLAIAVLLQAAKGVSKLYDAIESVLRKVKACLARVEVYLEPSTPPSPALMDVLIRTFVQVFIVLGIATKYCDKATNGDAKPKGKKGSRAFLRRMWDYFRGILSDTEVEDALKILDELTQEEQLIVAAQNNAIARDVQPRVKLVYDETVVDGIRSWLHAPDPRPANYDKKSKPGTCQWFIEGQQFQSFKASKGSVYWVYGKAGAGKSVLCSSALDALRDDATLLLAYFYLDYSILDKQEGWHGLIASLIFQIGTGPKACFDYLEKKWRSDHSRDRPTYSRLLEMLFDLLLVSGPTVLFVDALDELPESEQRTYLFPFLEKLRLLDPDRAKVRLFVTSRLESDIWQHCMTGPSRFATHVLNLDDAPEHRGELNVYVATQLSLLNLDRWPSMRAKAEKILVEKANGMFLWIDLQLPRLKRCVSVDDIEDTLLRLPTGLHGTYRRILENIDSSDTSIKRVRQVLECIASAIRPLTTAQVIEIFLVDIDSPAKTHIDSEFMESIDDPEAFILEKCPGFLNISDTPVSFWEPEPTHRTVQFAHFSVQEYLMSPDLQKSVSSARHYGVEKSSANITLGRICLSALVLDSPLLKLRTYADEHWENHVSSHNEDALCDLLVPFLYMESPSYARLVATQHKSSHHDKCDTALHCASRLGLSHIVERMLEKSRLYFPTPADFITKTRNGSGDTALHDAARMGHTEVCHLVLDHGVLVEDFDYNKNTPLHLAAHQGHLTIVRLLLEYPAADGSNAVALRLHIRDNKGQTVLHKAASSWNTEVCRFLLEHGALIDETDNNGETPLHLAAGDSIAHLDAVRFLLEYPVANGSNVVALRIRKHDNKGQTALHKAASECKTEVCRFLLEHGALIDETDNNGETPLHLAAGDFFAHLDTVRLLLEYPAADGSNAAALRLHIRDKEDKTVLHKAASECNTEVCRFLLEHGALIDDTDNNGETPLHLAAGAILVTLDTVRLLLEYPAADGSNVVALRIRKRDNEGQTALHKAASECKTEVCRFLLEHGALTDDTDNNGETPLHLAAGAILVTLDTVRLLLEYPAADGSNVVALRIRKRDDEGQTALHKAASECNTEVCRFLLEHGALIDDTNNNGETPLHLAAGAIFVKLDTVRLLLEYPAVDGSNAAAFRLHIRDKEDQTALHKAASTGQPNICRLLLEHGALVNETDNQGRTSLNLAKTRGALAIVDVLLKFGATDVSDHDTESGFESMPDLESVSSV